MLQKPAHCDPDDDLRRDWRNHLVYDAEHWLVLAVVPGARSIENAEAIVAEAHDRTEGLPDVFLTSDEYPAYMTAIDHVYDVLRSGPVVRPRRS